MPKSPDKPMQWTAKQEEALKFAFEGRWSGEEIALKCAVSPRTYDSWRAHPDFRKRLEELRADLAASLKDVAYADKAQRIVSLSQMAESARREYEARPWLKEVRPTRDGDVTNESFNRDAHAAYRDALNDIAKELGERSSKVDVTSGGERLSGLADALTALLSQPAAAGDVLDTLASRADRESRR